jgi:hypothetical protein
MIFDILLIENFLLVLHVLYQCTLFTCNFSLVIQANDFTYTCITVIDKVLLRKEVRQKGTD